MPDRDPHRHNHRATTTRKGVATRQVPRIQILGVAVATLAGSVRRPEAHQSKEEAGQDAQYQWQDGCVRVQGKGAGPESECGQHRGEVAGKALQLRADSHVEGQAEQERQTESDHGTPQPLIRYAV